MFKVFMDRVYQLVINSGQVYFLGNYR